MALGLPQPPRVKEARFDDWLWRFWKRVEEATGGEAQPAVNHATLSNLNSAAYSHLSEDDKTDLTDGGASALHYHPSDRARENHTGTQTAATISDFASAVAAAVGSGVGADSSTILSSQIFGS